MSRRDWQPGDVVFDTEDGSIGMVVENGYGCRIGPAHDGAGLHVHYEDGDWSKAPGSQHRPLLVIDVEDCERVEEVTRAIFGPLADAGRNSVVDGLRSLLTPPKPAEPLGLGAVVEDDKGDLWVRIYTHANDCNDWREVGGYRAGDDEKDHRRSYSELPAVRVLSQGVTP